MIEQLDFEKDGAVRLERAALPFLPVLDDALADVPNDRAGIRLYGRTGLAEMVGPDGGLGRALRPYITAEHRPVRSILFVKSAKTNWALGWHQDRTIAVKQRHDVSGFGPWSTKSGVQHVEPPFDLIEQMITVRIHLDDVPSDNAPLLVVPGSHRLGKLRDKEIEVVASQSRVVECLASAGDAWLYATPIVHASAVSAATGRRRVLQVDYASFELPGDLEWQGL